MTNWSSELDKLTEAFKSTFEDYSGEDLNWKPNSEMWSVAQNIDHLITINKTYFPILDALQAGTYRAPFIANFGFLAKLMGNAVLKASSPDREKKMKTFLLWEPSFDHIHEGILNDFIAHQKELKTYILQSIPFAMQGKRIASPASRKVVYSLETAFDIIVSHEWRHLNQAKEVGDLLKK